MVLKGLEKSKKHSQHFQQPPGEATPDATLVHLFAHHRDKVVEDQPLHRLHQVGGQGDRAVMVPLLGFWSRRNTPPHAPFTLTNKKARSYVHIQQPFYYHAFTISFI